MGTEIERKFLVTDERWRQGATGTLFRQGYLCNERTHSVRVRIEGDRARLTIKGGSTGIVRTEYEYDLPMDDAHELLEHMVQGPVVEKDRYRVPWQRHTWEIDEFLGANAGLVVAEVELQDATEAVALPPWVGAEVSEEPRYFNASLSRRPYCDWSDEEKSAT